MKALLIAAAFIGFAGTALAQRAPTEVVFITSWDNFWKRGQLVRDKVQETLQESTALKLVRLEGGVPANHLGLRLMIVDTEPSWVAMAAVWTHFHDNITEYKGQRVIYCNDSAIHQCAKSVVTYTEEYAARLGAK